MNNKSWLLYLDELAKGQRKALLGELAFRRDETSTELKARFFPDSPFSIPRDGQEAFSLELTNEANTLLQGEERKVRSMDDFKRATEADQIIANIREAAIVWDGYSDIYEETEPRQTRLLKNLPLVSRERDLFKLGLILIEAASFNHAELLKVYLENDFPVNFQHPRSNKTALHTAMAHDAQDFGKALIDSGRCDYLLKDNSGRTAYDVAFTTGTVDMGLSDLLKEETVKQAKMRGIPTNNLFEHQDKGFWSRRRLEI